MNQKIQIEPRHLEIVRKIIEPTGLPFSVFGSRAKGNAKLLSDLDLAIMEPAPKAVVSHLAESFDESDLPFKVDLVQWDLIDEGFKKRIEKDLIPLVPSYKSRP